ncbi:FHA domain-containing protein [Myxococcota bacterium]|nr:FHA domain-containing protein [Myxococcota bacterium]
MNEPKQEFETTVVDCEQLPADVAAEPPSALAEMAVISGPGAGTVATLVGGRLRIGRRPENELSLPDPRISGRHATVYYAASGEFRIRDRGSRNGTFLNGSRVQEYVVRDGDLIQVGSAVLRFRLSVRARG